MAYAENTNISVAKSKADIEDMILKHGARQFMFGQKENMAVISFVLSDKQMRFLLPLPDRSDRKFWITPGRGLKRTPKQAYKEWEQACRSKWRSLYLIIKAKLEAVESGISTIEREFLYEIVLPDGSTVGDWVMPQVERAYQIGQMPDMLPMLEDKSEK